MTLERAEFGRWKEGGRLPVGTDGTMNDDERRRWRGARKEELVKVSGFGMMIAEVEAVGLVEEL